MPTQILSSVVGLLLFLGILRGLGYRLRIEKPETIRLSQNARILLVRRLGALRGEMYEESLRTRTQSFPSTISYAQREASDYLHEVQQRMGV